MARSTQLQSEAGYIDARSKADRSTKTSCNARPHHTFGSRAAVQMARPPRTVYPQQRTPGMLTRNSASTMRRRRLTPRPVAWRLPRYLHPCSGSAAVVGRLHAQRGMTSSDLFFDASFVRGAFVACSSTDCRYLTQALMNSGHGALALWFLGMFISTIPRHVTGLMGPAAPPLRPERHIPNSIATMRRCLSPPSSKTLPRCPCCAAPIVGRSRPRNL